MSDSCNQTMVVTGLGKVTGKPDLVTIQLGITTHAEQLTDAQSENTKRSQSVIDRLLSQGIERDDIQTTAYTVSPQYDYIDGQQRFREYEVHHQLQVTVRTISIIGEVIDAAIQAGATEVSSIQFGIANASDLYELALHKAVEQAHNHAKALASAAEVVLNRVPVHIEENSRNVSVPIAIHQLKMSAAP